MSETMAGRQWPKPGNWRCGRCESHDEELDHTRHCRKHSVTLTTLCCLCDEPLLEYMAAFIEQFGWCHWACGMNYAQEKHREGLK
jgi:hypothetical protein